MESNSDPKQTEDDGSSPQSYTSLRFAPVERRPVTPPASLAKEKEDSPDDIEIEEAGGSIPNEAAKSPVDNPRRHPPTNSSARQPGPRPRRPLPNSPIRQRNSQSRKPLHNSRARRRNTSVQQDNDPSSNEPENPPVRPPGLPPGTFGISTGLADTYTNPTYNNFTRQDPGPIVRGTIVSPIGTNWPGAPDSHIFPIFDVLLPRSQPNGPAEVIRLLFRTSKHQPGFLPDWRVNAHWKENVERVLGRNYRDLWPNMMALISEAQASFDEKGPALIQRCWNQRETEIAARVKCWYMPNVVLWYLIGQPPKGLSMGYEPQFAIWAYDEIKRLDEVHGMEGFWRKEGEREAAAGSNDKAHEEKESEKEKEKEKEKKDVEEMETEKTDDDLQVYTRSMNR
ncbi:hypothetical protein ACHAP5_010365 [Fusarium lateritium]